MFPQPPDRSLFTRSQKLPLRLVLVVSFVLQIAAAVGLTTALSWRNGQKAIDDLAVQLSEKSIDSIREHQDAVLFEFQQAFGYDKEQLSEFITALEEALESHSNFSLERV